MPFRSHQHLTRAGKLVNLKAGLPHGCHVDAMLVASMH